MTVVLKAANGNTFELRKPCQAEAEHCEIYKILEMDPTVKRYPRSKQKSGS